MWRGHYTVPRRPPHADGRALLEPVDTRAGKCRQWAAPLPPADRWQAEDRTHRIGAIKECECIYLLAAGTFDEDVYDILTRKSEKNAGVMDSAVFSMEFTHARRAGEAEGAKRARCA